MEIFFLVLGFLPAVILHEYAHGWVAFRCGDPTAKMAGRLTLNPLKHIDPVGTLILPGLLILLRAPIVFGWAKPVPIDYGHLRFPRRDIALVALAGPLVNILLAISFSLLLKLNLSLLLGNFLRISIIINLGLAIFNLLPVPPLDGSRLVLALLPLRAARYFAQLESYGMIILVILLAFRILDYLVWPAVLYLAKLLGVT